MLIDAPIAIAAAPPASQASAVSVAPDVGNGWRWLPLVTSGVAVLAALVQLYSRGHGGEWVTGVAVIVLGWLAAFGIGSWCYFGHAYSLGLAYIVTVLVFHFGITLPVALQWFDLPELHSGAQAEALGRGNWASVLALGAFGLGYSIAMRNGRSSSLPRTPGDTSEYTLRVTYHAGVGLLCASVVFLVLGIAQVGNPLQYARMDFFHGVGDMRGLSVFMMTFPSAATLMLIGAHEPRRMIIGSLLSICAFLLFMLSGYRSAALFPLLAGVVVWRRVGRRVPWWLAVAGLSGVLIAIPAMSILRATGPYSDMSWSSVRDSFEQSDVRQAFFEMGSTIAIVSETMKLVPEKDPYRYGMSYVRALREAVPNILPQLRSWARGDLLSQGVMGRDDLGKLPPSDWITFRLEPLKFHSGEGLGFSAVGEAYLNFGVPGIILVFTLFGWIISRIDSTRLLQSPRLLIFCSAAFWPLLRTVRNDFDNFIKPLGFIYISLLVWALISKVLGTKPRRPEVSA